MSGCDHPGLLPMEAALERLLALAEAAPIEQNELVALAEADGRVLAEPLIAALDRAYAVCGRFRRRGR